MSDKGTPMNQEQTERVLQGIVSSFREQPRSPVLATPANEHLEYEDVTFPSADGVPLEAWFIPRPGSERLIIANHPRFFSRYGFPSHIEPWKAMFAAGGNDYEVNFIRDYKILHDAGYNVLTYDLRNHGHCGAGNGGICTGGIFESRDVIGSLTYAQTRADLRTMTVGLFSRCLGCSATMHAMARRPEPFARVRCLVGLQPVSPKVILQRTLELAAAPGDLIEQLDRGVRLATSFRLDEMSPVTVAKRAVVPTFLYQVRDDVMTRPTDVQAMFDNIPISDKELLWIEGTTKRWDGYTYFAKDPTKILAWFAKHLPVGTSA
jgi:pimeloyl-ACP methyl ester carboxylesterase